MAKLKTRGLNAAAWMATLSTAGRLDVSEPRIEPERPTVIVSECWDGKQWRERVCEWNGEMYVEVGQ